jgi:hypothetical protein
MKSSLEMTQRGYRNQAETLLAASSVNLTVNEWEAACDASTARVNDFETHDDGA